MYMHILPCLENNPNYVIFNEDDIQPQIQVPPPREFSNEK